MITQERRHLGFLKLIPQVHLLSRWSEMSLRMEPQRFVFSCFACSCVFAPSFAVILPSFYQRGTLKRSSLRIFSLVFIDADNLTMILIGGAVVLCGIYLWLWSGLYDDLKSHTHNTVRTTWIWTCSRLWRWQWTFREPPLYSRHLQQYCAPTVDCLRFLGSIFSWEVQYSSHTLCLEEGPTGWTSCGNSGSSTCHRSCPSSSALPSSSSLSPRTNNLTQSFVFEI